jgi:hypothetical protein
VGAVGQLVAVGEDQHVLAGELVEAVVRLSLGLLHLPPVRSVAAEDTAERSVTVTGADEGRVRDEAEVAAVAEAFGPRRMKVLGTRR